jgi:hypothetical protein
MIRPGWSGVPQGGPGSGRAAPTRVKEGFYRARFDAGLAVRDTYLSQGPPCKARPTLAARRPTENRSPPELERAASGL